MRVSLTLLLAVQVVALAACVDTYAQAPRAGAGERERGIINRMGARREERFNRGAPAQASAPAPGSSAAGSAGQRLGPLGNGPLPSARNRPGSPGNAAPQTPGAAPQAQANQALRAQGLGQAPVSPAGATIGRGSATASQRVAPYGISGEARPNQLPADETARELTPNRLPYDGPGVLIRLPDRLRGEVNYLVDDVEHLIVHSGESHHLTLKDRYEVRFSRGVKADGQSYGESRYTVTEGVYRFDVTSSGWELYREGEARDVQSAVRQAEERAAQMQQAANQPPPLPAPSKSSDPLPSPAVKETVSDAAVSEDTLPAPRSILEPT